MTELSVPAALWGTRSETKTAWRRVYRNAEKQGGWAKVLPDVEHRLVRSDEWLVSINKLGDDGATPLWHLYWVGEPWSDRTPLTNELVVEGCCWPWYCLGLHSNTDRGWAVTTFPGRTGQFFYDVLTRTIESASTILEIQDQVFEGVPDGAIDPAVAPSLNNWNRAVCQIAEVLYPEVIRRPREFACLRLQYIEEVFCGDRDEIRRSLEIVHQRSMDVCTPDWEPDRDALQSPRITVMDVLMAAGIVERTADQFSIAMQPTIDLSSTPL